MTDPGATSRERAGEVWAKAALGEHASIASFARFVLHLLQLGAPSELVARASRAMDDEIRHARLIFTLAARFSGRRRGPGTLAIPGDSWAMDDADILRAAIREGCVAETIAAHCIAVAVEHAEDPDVLRVLPAIRDDELRHAQLSWDFVEWLVATRPDLHCVLEQSFNAALSAPSGPSNEDDAGDDLDLELYGILGGSSPRTEARRVIDDVIRPQAAALLESTRLVNGRT